MQSLGEIKTGMSHLESEVQQIDQLDEIKERVITLEANKRIMSHAQLTSTQTQYPTSYGSFIELNSVDSIEGDIEFAPRISPTTITIKKNGSVLILVVPQIRRLPGYDGTACITVWLVLNKVDIQNSSIKNCISEGDDSRDTMTTTLQAILPMHKDDKIQIKMRSDPQGQIGIVALHPSDVPVVPSVIVSLLKMGT
jgi:hypothetical protein